MRSHYFFIFSVWLLLLSLPDFLIKGYVHQSMQRLGVILYFEKKKYQSTLVASLYMFPSRQLNQCYAYNRIKFLLQLIRRESIFVFM
jgi:hypothetical protein